MVVEEGVPLTVQCFLPQPDHEHAVLGNGLPVTTPTPSKAQQNPLALPHP